MNLPSSEHESCWNPLGSRLNEVTSSNFLSYRHEQFPQCARISHSSDLTQWNRKSLVLDGLITNTSSIFNYVYWPVSSILSVLLVLLPKSIPCTTGSDIKETVNAFFQLNASIEEVSEIEGETICGFSLYCHSEMKTIQWRFVYEKKYALAVLKALSYNL